MGYFNHSFIFFSDAIDEEVFGAFSSPYTVSIDQITIACQSAPTGAALTVDLVNAAGASLSALATLADGSLNQITTLGTPVELNPNTLVRAKIKSIGTTNPGQFIEVTISGTDDSSTTSGGGPVTVPSTINLCTVYGYQYINGTPTEGTRVSIQLNNVPASGSNVVFEDGPYHVDTDEAGKWEIDLIQGQNYLLTIWKAGILNRSIIVPAASSANITTLI